MKKIFILCLSLYASMFFSQEKYNLLVEYTLIKNTSTKEDLLKEYFLSNSLQSFYFTYNDNLKSYEEVYDKFEFKLSNNRIEFIPERNVFLELRTLKSLYYLKDFSPEIKWKVTNDKKEILGYKCFSALGSYRGRNYIVWFTNEIPNSYGPWKLSGLSGMILEAEDSNHYFHYVATRIVKNKDFYLPKLLEEKMNTIEENAINYKEFIKIENNFFEQLRSQIKSTYPKGTVFKEDPDVRELLKEKSFEWEETNKP